MICDTKETIKFTNLWLCLSFIITHIQTHTINFYNVFWIILLVLFVLLHRNIWSVCFLLIYTAALLLLQLDVMRSVWLPMNTRYLLLATILCVSLFFLSFSLNLRVFFSCWTYVQSFCCMFLFVLTFLSWLVLSFHFINIRNRCYKCCICCCFKISKLFLSFFFSFFFLFSQLVALSLCVFCIATPNFAGILHFTRATQLVNFSFDLKIKIKKNTNIQNR